MGKLDVESSPATTLVHGPTQATPVSGLSSDVAPLTSLTGLDKALLKDEGVKPPKPEQVVTRRELWSYYAYYIGNSGLGPFNFGPTQYQNILSLSGHNLDQPGVACDYSVPCVLPFAGVAQRTVASTVLVTNGIAFAIQVVIFLLIGSYADFGRWRPWILYAFTALAIAVSFAWLGVTQAGQWQAATALYVLGLIGYQGSLTFWTAAFPQLARDLPEMQESADQVLAGDKSIGDHEALDSYSRNRISNVAFIVCSSGEVLVLVVLIGILFATHANGSVAQNTTVTLISTLQYSTVAYSSITLNYLLIVGIVAQGAGSILFWQVQKRYHLSTKTCFTAVLVGLLFMILWGIVGIWTDKFGYRNAWEFWLYQAYYGLLVCPWYSYGQTMISEVIPPGREYLFFSLFGVIGKCSSFVGPFITSAIDTRTNNTSTGFWFLLAMCILSLAMLPFLNVERSRRDCAKFNAVQDSIVEEKLYREQQK